MRIKMIHSEQAQEAANLASEFYLTLIKKMGTNITQSLATEITSMWIDSGGLWERHCDECEDDEPEGWESE